MAKSKNGYLRYKCGCGAVIKVPVNDVFHALAHRLKEYLRPRTHQCDPKHIGIAQFIGGTFDEEQDNE